MSSELSSFNYDSLTRTTLRDNSIVPPTPENLNLTLSALQPFFSGEGEDNKIRKIGNLGRFDIDFGDDVANVKKYGHNGLLARHILQAGGNVHACRLMPEHSKKSSMVLVASVSEPVQRT